MYFVWTALRKTLVSGFIEAEDEAQAKSLIEKGLGIITDEDTTNEPEFSNITLDNAILDPNDSKTLDNPFDTDFDEACIRK